MLKKIIQREREYLVEWIMIIALWAGVAFMVLLIICMALYN